jgi:hypothetical protein
LFFNLHDIHEAKTFGNAQYEAAVGEYERFATVPSSKYGDSIAPLRSEFGAVLEANGIAVTEDNMRAAYILSRSRMDVTAENVRAVAEIDAKINSITENLHPMIAAQMLKDGLRPLEMHADEVLKYIRQFNRELGEGGSEAIAKHIVEMDKENTLDADTREKMIAVYRMLHVIQKDGAAALGLAAKQDANLTLGGLMELAKYLRNSRKASSVMDISSGEGYLERLTRPAESIRAILEREPSPAPGLTELIAENFAKTAEPARLRDWLEGDATGTPVEELAREAAEEAERTSSEELNERTARQAKPIDVSAEALQVAVEQVHFFASSLPALIQYLQSRNIPATGGNLRALSKLAGRSTAMSEALDELEDSGELPLEDTSLEALRSGEAPESLMARAWAELESRLPTPPVTAAKEIVAMQNGLNGEGGFSVPIRVNGRVSKLSLYVLNERALHEDGARVFMSLETSNLGTVQGYFSINGGVMDLRINARDGKAGAVLEGQLDTLKAALNESGITLSGVSFTTGGEGLAPDMPVPAAQTAPSGQAVKRVPLSAHEYLA